MDEVRDFPGNWSSYNDDTIMVALNLHAMLTLFLDGTGEFSNSSHDSPVTSVNHYSSTCSYNIVLPQSINHN